MIDPLISLAFSMHNAKGVYAVLLGSGVSTAAGIPTGWGIILDIIRKVSEVCGESCEPEPEKWYQQKFGEPPNYSKLLDQLGKTASERNTILRPYIEPTAEEREQNLKVPSKAHHAIARLAAAGYIKVILSTNFDRLMESALEAAGVSPTVIASADAVAGATPLTHATCSVIKLHGDYLDTRIKNTLDELAVYDERINNLLARVLDEYGLIVCGWSAEWDQALRGAFERCPNRRYTTYWAARGRLSEKAQALINHRQAQVIPIDGADSFFESLAERVFALESLSRPHPLTTATAIAMLKKYLPDPQQAIRQYDLIVEQTERLVVHLTSKQYDSSTTPTEESIWSRMAAVRNLQRDVDGVNGHWLLLGYFRPGTVVGANAQPRLKRFAVSWRVFSLGWSTTLSGSASTVLRRHRSHRQGEIQSITSTIDRFQRAVGKWRRENRNSGDPDVDRS